MTKKNRKDESKLETLTELYQLTMALGHDEPGAHDNHARTVILREVRTPKWLRWLPMWTQSLLFTRMKSQFNGCVVESIDSTSSENDENALSINVTFSYIGYDPGSPKGDRSAP